ncbi:HAD family phosphatase [Arthrobacter sp. LAPM80]|uniref:HAD family hydrolase n=1 Tax=Arthrobacter sp. LAPM80 TaxID=3141788 RepID=UPI00398A620E
MLSPSADAVNGATTPPTELKAVLWDMDGTLVDTEPYWIAAEIELVLAHGGHWDEELAHSLIGAALTTSARVLREAGVKLSVREVIDHLSHEVIAGIRREIPWRPGARELLDELHGRGVRCALVTMSERNLATEVVNALDKDYFEFLVTGDEVANGKPHPEPYLTAVDRLRESDPTITVAHCAALEDSVPGVASAVASGVATIAIPNAVSLPEDPGYTSWRTLAGKTYDDVATVVATRAGLVGAAL